MDTSMIDIYEAAGATVNKDRTQVSMNPSKMKPFEIVMTVYPQTLISDSDGERIIFAVMLHDDIVVDRPIYGGEPIGGGVVRQIDYSGVEVELPVKQVRIHKKAES